MNQRKRWATWADAQKYIEKAIKTRNYGLKYVSACDFLRYEPVKYKEYREKRAKRIIVDLYLPLCTSKDLKTIQEVNKTEIYEEQYTNIKFKRDEGIISYEEENDLISEELKERSTCINQGEQK